MQSFGSLTSQEQAALLRLKKDVGRICGRNGWEMRIFGSRARMEGSEESDVDVLVLIAEGTEKQKVDIWDAAYRIFADTGILLSPHVLSKKQFDQMKARERLIVKEIERDGFTI